MPPHTRPQSLTACPICDGRLEATQEVYRVDVVLSADGAAVENEGRDSGLGEDLRVYCENDHTQAEIAEYLKEYER